MFCHDIHSICCDSKPVTGCSAAVCPGVNNTCSPGNRPQSSPNIIHSICLDSKHVTGPSGAAPPGMNSVGVPGNRPQKSAKSN